MPQVELRFTPVPGNVRTARLVAVQLARRSGVDEDRLDEVRLAVGEACGRAVRRHRLACPDRPVLLRLSDDESRFVAEVVDEAGPEPAAGDSDPIAALAALASGEVDTPAPAGVDLALIAALVPTVEISEDGSGSAVRMAWPGEATSEPAVDEPTGRGTKA